MNLLSGLFVLLTVAFPQTAIASSTTEVKMTIPEKIAYYSDKYDVSEKKVRGIIACESGFVTNIQSKARYQKDNPKLGIKAGEQERSFGLAQIHLPAHTDITYEQAIDEDFAIDFVAKHLKAGDAPNMYVHCYNSVKDV